MKNYLSLHLKGEQLFPYWISTYLLGIVLAVIYYVRSRAILAGDMSFDTSLMIVLTALLLVAVYYIYFYYSIRFTTESMEYKGERFEVSYTTSQFLSTFLLGLFLSLITFGLYIPWLIRSIVTFFLEGSSYRGVRYSFLSDGLTLFGIITLLIIVPIIAISFIGIIIFGIDHPEKSSMLANIYQLIIIAPYYTLLSKWLLNARYGEYRISLKVSIAKMAAFIFGQIVLTIITAGIYFPVYMLKMYRYVLRHIECVNGEGEQVRLDYDLDAVQDWLFTWGQILLTIVTLGVYVPWMYAKVTARVLGKTSVTE
jgi:uncharacterized membrane protein YjgN (DUF898 family)